MVTEVSVTLGGDSGDKVCFRTKSSEADVFEGGEVIAAIFLESRSMLAAHVGLEADERNGGAIVNMFMMGTENVFCCW